MKTTPNSHKLIKQYKALKKRVKEMLNDPNNPEFGKEFKELVDTIEHSPFGPLTPFVEKSLINIIVQVMILKFIHDILLPNDEFFSSQTWFTFIKKHKEKHKKEQKKENK